MTCVSAVSYTHLYSFSKEGVLEVGEDGKVRAVGAGEVVVTASQPGSDDFTPAESEPMTLTVAKAPLNVSLADDAWTWRGIAAVSYTHLCRFRKHLVVAGLYRNVV